MDLQLIYDLIFSGLLVVAFILMYWEHEYNDRISSRLFKEIFALRDCKNVLFGRTKMLEKYNRNIIEKAEKLKPLDENTVISKGQSGRPKKIKG